MRFMDDGFLLPVAMELSVVCGFSIAPFGPLMGYGFFRWLEKHPRSLLIGFQHRLRPWTLPAFSLALLIHFVSSR